MDKSTTAVLKYTLLPGLVPRLLALFRGGFHFTAYLIALVYANVRLLPATHPYLNPANMGRFGVRHVLAAASGNLVFSRKHIDQIIVYFTLLAGMVILAAQVALVLLALITSRPVLANNNNQVTWTQLFTNTGTATAPNIYGSLGPRQDIAFMLLDQVFGTVGIFGSCISTPAQPCQGYFYIDPSINNPNATPSQTPQAYNMPTGPYPWPFHRALHTMLWFYSSGIFLVGALVILYFVTTIALETAESGTPFGQRFNRAWVPIRLIFFFALLIPLGTSQNNAGLNMAQLTTFAIAKYGSNFATNAWSLFSTGGTGNGNATGLPNSFLAQNRQLVARPNVAEETLIPILQFMNVASTCRSSYNMNGGNILPYLVRSAPPNGYTPAPHPGDLGGLLPNAHTFNNAVPFADALSFSMFGNITIVFGTQGRALPNNSGVLDPKYRSHLGGIMPYCGSITIPVTSVGQPGAREVAEQYYELIQDIWNNPNMLAATQCLVRRTTQAGQTSGNGANCTDRYDRAYIENLKQQHITNLQTALQTAFNAQNNAGSFAIPQNVLERGWAGASIWYNKIAEMNGAVTSAMMNVPKADRLPMLLRSLQAQNNTTQQSTSVQDQFKQAVDSLDDKNNSMLSNLSDREREMVVSMREAFDAWGNGTYGSFQSNQTSATGNIVIDTINNILGTSGVFDMRRNTDVHPLAQLSALGKGIMEAAINNAFYATALAAGSGIVKKNADLAFVGGLAQSLSTFLFSTFMATIAIGVLLYMVLPFMPFIYFFFAVSGWLKSIFEAIVAMPLWALAHLRIDGPGLPGPGATNGYFLLLEIFLRPILIVIGFLGGITIFSALVSVLNQVFDIVVANAGGFDAQLEAQVAAGTAPPSTRSQAAFGRGPLDELFFTAIYAILCYMMGLSCFKMVDQVPNNILRWVGASVSTFQENAGDPAGQLSSNIYHGTQLTANKASRMVGGVTNPGGDLMLLTQ